MGSNHGVRRVKLLAFGHGIRQVSSLENLIFAGNVVSEESRRITGLVGCSRRSEGYSLPKTGLCTLGTH